MLDSSFDEFGMKTVECFDATSLLGAPFSVFLHGSVEQKFDADGNVLETVVPDPDGLVKAVAMLRSLHSDKLTHDDLKFMRSAIEIKASALAKILGISPEHMSRLESGDKVLQPQTETVVRMFTFAKSVVATKSKEASVSDMIEDFASIFEGIAPCKPVGAPKLEFHLSLAPCADGASEDGLWDVDAPRVA